MKPKHKKKSKIFLIGIVSVIGLAILAFAIATTVSVEKVSGEEYYLSEIPDEFPKQVFPSIVQLFDQ